MRASREYPRQARGATSLCRKARVGAWVTSVVMAARLSRRCPGFHLRPLRDLNRVHQRGLLVGHTEPNKRIGLLAHFLKVALRVEAVAHHSISVIQLDRHREEHDIGRAALQVLREDHLMRHGHEAYALRASSESEPSERLTSCSAGLDERLSIINNDCAGKVGV